MDNLSRSAGVGPTIELGGRQFTTNGKILQHYAEIEAEYVKRRGNPFELAREAAAALKENAENSEFIYTLITQMFDEARKWQIVNINEMLDWLQITWAGRCMHVWLAVRESAPGIKLDEVTQLFMQDYEEIRLSEGQPKAEEWVDKIFESIRQGDGEDELGNSNGSPTSETSEAAGSPSTGT